MAEPDHIDVIALPSGRRLEARVHRPAPASPDLRTAVIQVHGGGWRIGSPAMLARRSDALARRGFTAIAVAYRLLDEAPWPTALHDVRSAVRWVRANAERLGVDATRIVLQGHSAGGHLALLAAGEPGETVDGDAYHPEVPASVAAVVAFYPPTDLRGAGERLLGAGHRADEATAASPITRAHVGFPPTLLLHGLADTMVAPAASEAMHRALLDAGATSELHLFAGQIHEFDAAASMCELTQELAANFVARHLIDPARFEAEQAADNPLWPR